MEVLLVQVTCDSKWPSIYEKLVKAHKIKDLLSKPEVRMEIFWNRFPLPNSFQGQNFADSVEYYMHRKRCVNIHAVDLCWREKYNETKTAHYITQIM